MKVLLVDDHALFLEGMQNLLTSRGIDVVGIARDGLEALAQARALRPDVILMDVRMPRCDGLAATRLIKAELPEAQIVMLTTSDEDEDLFEAIRSGASGYLLKSLNAPDFFALCGVGAGRGSPLTRPGGAHTGRVCPSSACATAGLAGGAGEPEPAPDRSPHAGGAGHALQTNRRHAL
ncbi:MAG: response regulator transcription factor, partial [Chloroflexi bacterium]|nr:response regulator transcription factor [Chloroflexota bacterium]